MKKLLMCFCLLFVFGAFVAGCQPAETEVQEDAAVVEEDLQNQQEMPGEEVDGESEAEQQQ